MQKVDLSLTHTRNAQQLKQTVFRQAQSFFVALFFTALLPAALFAQVPAVSYTSPQNYYVNTAITTLSPSNSGGAVAAPGYSSSKTTVFSGTSYDVFARDAAGNLYAFDYSNSSNKKLVKLSSTGALLATFLTFMGSPRDIAVDAAGNIFALDGSTLYKITPGGSVSTITSSLPSANGIALDAADNVYVASYSASITSVIEVPAAGGSNINIGSGLGYMTDVAIDAAGNIYVCNDYDASIKEIPAGGGSLITIASGFTSFSTADLTNIIVDGAGNIFFTERNGGKASEIFAGTNTPVQISSGFFAPAGLALDASGNLYIGDSGSVYKVAPIGGFFISPALPAGLSFDGTTGAISGTPTVLGTATDYTITAYNSSGSSAAVVNIAVVSPPPITDDNLSGLSISTGTLSPGFNPNTFSYTVSVLYAVTSVTLTLTSDDPNATITSYGGTIPSGGLTDPIPLAPGLNTVHIIVLARDGVTKNVYSVGVTRLPASTNADLTNLTLNHNATFTPTFAPGQQSYTSNVPYTTNEISITPACDTTATVKVNNTAVTSGIHSQRFPLNVGANILTLVVKAEDGTTTKTYTVTVTRAASPNTYLSNLRLNGQTLSPAFIYTTTSYTANVPYFAATVKVTPTSADAAATITVNNVAATSRTSSAATPLNVGDNTIDITVTAADGVSTKTYTITVTRAAAPADANLSNLLINGQTMSPAFIFTTTVYTSNVSNATSSVNVIPTPHDAAATVTVNNIPFSKSAPASPVALNVGNNIITTVVTGADGITTKTYTIAVTRAAPSPDNSVYQPLSVEKPIANPGLETDGIVVHQGISPNGDGQNDFLVIDGITAYPDNKLTVMNRNGVLVYEAKGYDNSQKVFDGHSNKTGAMQLPGTYFYSLEYSVKGTIKHKTGFIVLKY